MSVLPALQHFDITLDSSSPNEDILGMLSKIKSHWKPEDVTIKEMTGGYVNKMFSCTHKQSSEDSVVVRIFGESENLTGVLDRDQEYDVLRVLAHKKLVPPVYCKFKNGMVYGYAKGDTIKRNLFFDDDILRLIAEKLHRIHAINIEDYVDKFKNNTPLALLESVWTYIMSHDMTQLENDSRYKSTFPSLDELVKEKAYVQNIYEELCQNYPIVFSHGDLYYTNIIWDEVSRSVTLIDWETNTCCPEIIDPIFMFDIDHDISEGVFHDDECRRKWIHTYLSTHPVHGKGDLPTNLFDKWFNDSFKVTIFCTFSLALWYLSAMNDVDDPSLFIGNAVAFYKIYLDIKAEHGPCYNQ